MRLVFLFTVGISLGVIVSARAGDDADGLQDVVGVRLARVPLPLVQVFLPLPALGSLHDSYHLYLDRSAQAGRELDDWLIAE